MSLKVSVIIPCRNEQGTITRVLESIEAQSYPSDQLEVIIADGLSTDGTREQISRYSSRQTGLSIRVIENPKKSIPAALNAAIAVARGGIVLRLDAHSFPDKDYVRFAVEDLQAGKGTAVGGVWIIKPGGDGWIARSISFAASNRLGVGDALYRIGSREGAVDTVPFGAFHRKTAEEIGGFDETLLTNEDYEFNARIRRNGGTIWLDPRIKSNYLARASLRELAKQYWRYGFWKNRMLRLHPKTLRLRQALPPLFLLTLVVLFLFSFGSEYARYLLILMVGIYLAALIAASVPTAYREKDMKCLVGIPLSIMVMHFAWGAGFLFSFLAKSHGEKPA